MINSIRVSYFLLGTGNVITCPFLLYIPNTIQAVAFGDHLEDQPVPDGPRHPDAVEIGIDVLPRFRDMVGAVVEGLDDGAAAGGLHRHHARTPGADPADGLQFGKRLPHADEPGAAAGRIEDHVGHVPAQLLGQLQAHGLLSLDAVGLLEGRQVVPAHGLGALADDPGAVVDQAVDPVDPGPVIADLPRRDLRRVLGREDEGLHAGTRPIGRRRGARVAGGGHRDALHPEGLGHGHGEGHAARLERSGGQAAFVLDHDLAAAQALAHAGQRDQRRHRLAQADDVVRPDQGQQLPVAPHVGPAAGQVVPGNGPADGVQIVAHEQRLARPGQPMQSVGGVVFAGFAAFQMGHECGGVPVRIDFGWHDFCSV